MSRYLVAALVFGLLTCSAVGQEPQGDGGNAQQKSTEALPTKEEFPGRPELLRQIALFEAAARRAETEHSSGVSLAKIYLGLGLMYQNLAMYSRSEQSIRRAAW